MPEDEYQKMYNQDMLTDQQIQDHNCPGPFSFLGYLKALLEPDFWGDELCLCLLSMAFQIGITVINAERFTCIRLRHKQTIPSSNVVLCHCKGQHYVHACKFPILLCDRMVKVMIGWFLFSTGLFSFLTGQFRVFNIPIV